MRSIIVQFDYEKSVVFMHNIFLLRRIRGRRGNDRLHPWRAMADQRQYNLSRDTRRGVINERPDGEQHV